LISFHVFLDLIINLLKHTFQKYQKIILFLLIYEIINLYVRCISNIETISFIFMM
jgi:hypothetical protein